MTQFVVFAKSFLLLKQTSHKSVPLSTVCLGGFCNATTCTSTILPAPRTDVASTYPVLCSRRAMCVSRTRRQPMSLPFPVLYGLPQQCNDAIANCLYYYNCIVPSSVVICTPAKAFGHIARIFVVHLNILLYTL